MRRRPLSIVHVTASAGGGAGRAAHRIADSVSALGHDSTLLTADPTPGEGRIVIEPRQRELSETQTLARRFLGDFLQHKYVERLRDLRPSNTLFSPGMDAFDLAAIPLLRAADIVHIHFLPRIGTPNALRQILGLGKPVVWTLHDQWAFTGGCHYSAGCRRFETTCGECPQIRRDPWRLPALLQAEKAACFAEGALTIVTPSDWMGECAAASAVLRGAPVRTIRNPIDLARFRPMKSEQRLDLRERFGIAEGDVVLVAGSISNREHRKGFDLLEEGLRGFVAEGGLDRLGGRLWLMTFGSHQSGFSIEGIESLTLGSIGDDEALAAILGIGDVVVLPSREDNYPNIMVEAMACGTPVAGFQLGGIGEVVHDGVNGLLMGEVPEAAGIAAMLMRVAGDPTMLPGMRQAARATMAPSHGLVPTGMAYEAVYKSLLPLPRIRSATIPARRDDPAPMRIDRLFRQVPVAPIMVLGPAFASEAVEKPLLAALRAYVEAKGEIPSPDSFITEHAGLAVPQSDLDTIIGEAQSYRMAYAAETLNDQAVFEAPRPPPPPPPPPPAPPAPVVAVPVGHEAASGLGRDLASTEPRSAAPRPRLHGASPSQATRMVPTFRKAVMLDTAEDFAAGSRLGVTIWSNDATLPLDGWSVSCEGELLPLAVRRQETALAIEFERSSASPAGTTFDILSPAVQGFPERDQARLLARPIVMLPSSEAPIQSETTALAAEGWEGFYAPELVEGRWMRWMSPRGHVVLPRWVGRAVLVVEGYLRPSMLTEKLATLSIGRIALGYSFEPMPGAPASGEGLWRIRAELPPPPRAIPPVLSISASAEGWPRTPGDPRELTMLLAAVRIEP